MEISKKLTLFSKRDNQSTLISKYEIVKSTEQRKYFDQNEDGFKISLDNSGSKKVRWDEESSHY